MNLLVTVEVYERAVLSVVLTALALRLYVVFMEFFTVEEGCSTYSTDVVPVFGKLLLVRHQVFDFGFLPFLPISLECRVVWRRIPFDQDMSFDFKPAKLEGVCFPGLVSKDPAIIPLWV